MLYKENTAKTLSEELFKTPTKHFRGTPFWSFNCKLEKDELLRQIGELKEMGFGGFHMHARSGLDTPYLSDEFMALVRACCDKATDEDMLAWLYDEDRWASGTAGGKVTADVHFQRRRLFLSREDRASALGKEEALAKGEPYFLAAYDVTVAGDGYLADFHRIARDAAAKGTKWYAFVVNDAPTSWFNNAPYLDIMDRETVAAFIRITHERYKETVGDLFDTTVPAIFSDEPNVQESESHSIPDPQFVGDIVIGWSRYFEEAYEKAYGESLLDRLPELFWLKRDSSDRLTKYRFFDLRAALFSENYCGQIAAWCEKNGISSTGHLLNERNLAGQTMSCGEVMRSYGRFTIPGIDMLCNNREFTTAKQTQSAVHQYGKEAMMSELYGVTNWDFDFRGHKFQGDWQAALGVTVRVPHLSWVSMAGEAKRDYPASIHYQSPWYKEYPLIENHFARLNTALTRGTPLVSIGVIHPVESFWITTGPTAQCGVQRQTLEENFATVTDWLLGSQLDFDFICESQLPSLADEKDARKVGRMHYDAIVVPAALTLRGTTVAFLEKFRENGGSVIFMGACPQFVDAKPSDGCRALFAASTVISFDKAALTAALAPVRTVGITDNGGHAVGTHLYAYRQDTDGRWLFIARKDLPGAGERSPQNDVLSPDTLHIRIKGAFTPLLYDTVSGDISPLPFRIENGDTLITRVVGAYDSTLIKLLPPTVDSLQETKTTVHVFEKTERLPAVPFTLGEPNVLLLDTAAYALDDGALQPEEEMLRLDARLRRELDYPRRDGALAQPYTLPKETPQHTLHLHLAFDSEIDFAGAQLALEDAESVKIEMNGKPVPSVVTGYFTDRSIKTVALPPIEKGENRITLHLPYGKRTNVEWCYVLGAFGVQVAGTQKTVTPLPEKLAFADVTTQGLPFYGANIDYHIPVTMHEDAKLAVHASLYRGALIGVSVDGERAGSIALPPYTCALPLKKGAHTLTLTLFGNRMNSFGQVHLVNTSHHWFGPSSYRTEDDNWSYEYQLKRFGILKSPTLTEYTEEPAR